MKAAQQRLWDQKLSTSGMWRQWRGKRPHRIAMIVMIVAGFWWHSLANIACHMLHFALPNFIQACCVSQSQIWLELFRPFFWAFAHGHGDVAWCPRSLLQSYLTMTMTYHDLRCINSAITNLADTKFCMEAFFFFDLGIFWMDFCFSAFASFFPSYCGWSLRILLRYHKP